MSQNLSDPVIDEIRAIRERIWAECHHDPAKLVAYYGKLQERYQDRVVDYSGAPAVEVDDIDCPACRESPTIS